jgi:hypothetical protein
MKKQIILVGKKISLPVKIEGDSFSIEIAESEYDNQTALSSTISTGEGIKL